MDLDFAMENDPAATSKWTVFWTYGGFNALMRHRFAHWFYKHGCKFFAFLIAKGTRKKTGVDIHPAAEIAGGVFIDHGVGVVIGETAKVGTHVVIYQGVTLGAKSFPLDADGKPIKGIPRHPILEDDVIVYSNATILGRITVGRGATVGGNIWVTENVPAGARVVQRR